jgi:hypothetical protein
MRDIRAYTLIGLMAVLLLFLATAYAAAPVPDPGVKELPETPLNDAKTAEEKPEKKQSFDNSRTDIKLYNEMVTDKNRVKSVFYSETEIKDVHLAVNTYLKNIGRGGDLTFDEEAFLSRLGGLKATSSNQNGQSRFFTYPQFFLNSLVYYAPDDWIVWINGEKITQATPRENSNIHVTAITPDKITLEWFPLEIHRVMEIWKLFPNEKVTVDEAHKQVVFDLKPNQTFSSYTMTALEGKVLPVTVDITKSVVPFAFDDTAEEEKKPEGIAVEPKKVIPDDVE